MKINVTKSDIRSGVRYKYDKCPVARAIKRATGKKNIIVIPTGVLCGKKSMRLPNIAAEFISDFDAKRLVEPFSFNLKLK